MPQQASEDDWFRAYGEVYEALPGESHTACPNCGHYALRVVFKSLSGMPSAAVSFWCDNCNYGLRLSRARIPDGVQALPLDVAADSRRIPEFIDVQTLNE